MIDDLHGDDPIFRLIERQAARAVERAPRRLVNVRPQRPLEVVVSVIVTEEIGVADEDVLLVQ